MALPYPTKVVLPFDIATAQDMNERHANDVALANGSGLGDGAVTPEKRTGGFKVMNISIAAGTGSKSFTGVGFRPKSVILLPLRSAITFESTFSIFFWDGTTSTGSRTGSRVQTTSGAFTTSGPQLVLSGFSSGSEATPLVASLTSFDEDGMTINVTTNSGAPHSIACMFFG